MEFLNLSVGQFLAVATVITGLSLALYLFDNTRRKQVISTFQFWLEAGQNPVEVKRRRIHQPLSLLLQLLGMLLLLLSIARFEFSSPALRHDHVLVLDTSAWMAADSPEQADATLMDVSRDKALTWLRSVPLNDRVMLIRADGLATPATAWELDRRVTARAIIASKPGATAINLAQSLRYASALQNGEIVYVGPGRMTGAEVIPELPKLHVIPVKDPQNNWGIRSVSAHRSEAVPGAWDVVVRTKNYSPLRRRVNLSVNFGHAPQGAQTLELASGAEAETAFVVRARAAGIVETRLYPKDAFAGDNYAELELPESRSLHVVVYSNQPQAIRPALEFDPRVIAEYRSPARYTSANDGLIVLDRFQPASAPRGNVLWLASAAGDRIANPVGLEWTANQQLTAGLRTSDLRLASATVLKPASGDVVMAKIANGPVVLAHNRNLVIGFDPFDGPSRFELATPLLMANALRWFAPEVFRDLDTATQSAGDVAAPVSALDAKQPVTVITETGARMPFNIRDKAVQFFAGEPARVTVSAGNTERVYSLTLPEVPDTRWTPPASAKLDIGTSAIPPAPRLPLWLWLAGLGITSLLVEWFVFGRAA